MPGLFFLHFDLAVCNPPWVPEPPKNRVDRAVFEDDSQMLKGYLEGLPKHLEKNRRGALLLSTLAELLGLRVPGWLKAEFERCLLKVVSRFDLTAAMTCIVLSTVV